MKKVLMLFALVLIASSCSKSPETSQSSDSRSELERRIDLEKLIEYGNIQSDVTTESTVIKDEGGVVLESPINPVTITKDEQGLQVIKISNKERRRSVSLTIDEGSSIDGVLLDNSCGASLGRRQVCYIKILIDPSNISVGTTLAKTLNINGQEMTFQYTVQAASGSIVDGSVLDIRGNGQDCGNLKIYENEKCEKKIELVNISRETIDLSIDDSSLPSGISMESRCSSTLRRRRACYLIMSIDSSGLSEGAISGSVTIGSLSASISANLENLTAQEIEDQENAEALGNLEIDSSNLNLGDIQNGEVKSNVMSIRNNSRESINLNLDVSNLIEFQVSGCPSTLERYKTCYLNLVYDSSNKSSGAKSESFSLLGQSYNLQSNVIGGGSSPVGNGYTPNFASLVINPSPYSYANYNENQNIISKLPAQRPDINLFQNGAYVAYWNYKHLPIGANILSPSAERHSGINISEIIHVYYISSNSTCNVIAPQEGVEPDRDGTNLAINQLLKVDTVNETVSSITTEAECALAAQDVFQSDFIEKDESNVNVTRYSGSNIAPFFITDNWDTNMEFPSNWVEAYGSNTISAFPIFGGTETVAAISPAVSISGIHVDRGAEDVSGVAYIEFQSQYYENFQTGSDETDFEAGSCYVEGQSTSGDLDSGKANYTHPLMNSQVYSSSHTIEDCFNLAKDLDSQIRNNPSNNDNLCLNIEHEEGYWIAKVSTSSCGDFNSIPNIKPTCSEIYDENLCYGFSGCQYNMDNSECYTSCEEISDESTCNESSYCSYDGSSCVEGSSGGGVCSDYDFDSESCEMNNCTYDYDFDTCSE